MPVTVEDQRHQAASDNQREHDPEAPGNVPIIGHRIARKAHAVISVKTHRAQENQDRRQYCQSWRAMIGSLQSEHVSQWA